MAVRPSAIRPIPGFSTIATKTLAALAVAGGIASAQPTVAAPGNWSSDAPRSVLVQSPANSLRGVSARARQSEEIVPHGMPIDQGNEFDQGNQFDQGISGEQGYPAEGEGMIVGSPDASGDYPVGSQNGSGGTNYNTFADSYQDGLEGGYQGQEPGQFQCGTDGCNGGCNVCQGAGFSDPAWRFNAHCEPAGLFQKLWCLGRCCESDGMWTGRVDALILSRNAPGFRPLYTFNPGAAGNALNANQLESIASVGPRISLFHRDNCGTAWEATYLYSGAFVANQNLALLPGGYLTAPPGISGNTSTAFALDTVSARLTSSLQSAELNRRWNLGPCSQFLAGFRWFNWQENLTLADSFGAGTVNAGQDLYNTDTYNNLYGGQIGLDTMLWQPSKHFRLEGLVKAGAYYNSASQSSTYQTTGFENSVNVGLSPATCSFAGELGLTGVVPINCNLDFRFGYFGLWLTSIAQPTNQLSGQSLAPGNQTLGSLATNGNVVLQGLSLGLEGRW